MRNNFNTSFLLINEINEIKQKISGVLEFIENIEKVEESCDKNNENIANIVFSYSYIKNGSSYVGNTSVNNLVSKYIGSNFFEMLGEIKKSKNKEIETLTLELKQKSQQLETETGNII